MPITSKHPGATARSAGRSTKPAHRNASAPSRAATTLTILFRLAIAVLALASWLRMLQKEYVTCGWAGAFDQAIYFTSLSVMVVGFVYAWLAIRGISARTDLGGLAHGTQWARGLAVLMSTITGIIFKTMLSGTYPEWQGLAAHAIVPIAVAIEWLLCGRDQALVRWWMPLTWLAILVPYIPLYVWDARRDAPMYAFLDPSKPNFVQMLVALVVGFAIWGYVLMLVGRLTARLRH